MKRSFAMLAHLHLPAVLLWTTSLLVKAATFAFGFKVGRAGGVEALGAMASLYVVIWIVGTTTSLGMSDWAVFHAARDRARGEGPSAQLGVGHGLFLTLSGAAYLCVFAAAPLIGGVEGLAGFVRWLALAATFQHLGTYGISCLRGLGRPAAEMAANGGCAIILAAGSLWAPDLDALGPVVALSNLSYLAAGLFAAIREPNLRPALREASQVVPQATRSLAYLALGVGAYLLGNADLLLARVFLPPAEVGLLLSATVIVRGAAAGPWMLATLSLHRLEVDPSRGASLGRRLGPALGLALAVMVSGWLALPLLAWGYGVALEQIRLPAMVALGAAPLLYGAVMLVPLSALHGSRRTVTRIGAALGVTALAGALLVPALGVVGAVLAAASGQAAMLALLWRAPPLAATAEAPPPAAPEGVPEHSSPS